MAEKASADSRVTALGLIIKLTDDVFKAPDFDAAAAKRNSADKKGKNDKDGGAV